MANLLTNTLTDPPPIVDFYATDVRGLDKLITQFIPFEEAAPQILNSLTEINTIKNTLRA